MVKQSYVRRDPVPKDPGPFGGSLRARLTLEGGFLMKRVLSLFLCAVLLCSVLPVHVSAGDPDPLTVKIGMWRVTDYNGVFATSIRIFTGESLAGTLIDDENTNLLVAWDAESATIYVEKNPDCKFLKDTVSSIYVSGGQDYDCINVRLGEDVYLDEVGANETETTLCPSLKIIGSGKLGSVDMLYNGNPTAYKGTDRGNIILADSVALSFEKYYRDLQNGWEVLRTGSSCRTTLRWMSMFT